MKKTFGMPSTRNNWPHSPAATMNVADQTATGSSGSGPQKPQRNLRLFRFRCSQKVLVQTSSRDNKCRSISDHELLHIPIVFEQAKALLQRHTADG